MFPRLVAFVALKEIGKAGFGDPMRAAEVRIMNLSGTLRVCFTIESQYERCRLVPACTFSLCREETEVVIGERDIIICDAVGRRRSVSNAFF
jgi:hypothetical protein